ncbi:MAG: hypothetical protein K0S57_1832 [Ramlibacter sp.]|nr:hypothetical protein [Ramlibacter sp.]
MRVRDSASQKGMRRWYFTNAGAWIPGSKPWIPAFAGMTSCGCHLWLSALLTSFDVMSTIWIILSYAMRVGPITPSVPTTCPSTS